VATRVRTPLPAALLLAAALSRRELPLVAAAAQESQPAQRRALQVRASVARTLAKRASLQRR
jgi:hypothetical protein